MKRTSVTRKMALILAAIVLMTASGCGRRENADKEDNNITIYKSNENADGFDTETVSLDALTPENIMAALIDAGVVPSDVKVLDFKQKIGIFNLISFIKGTLLKINYNIY